MAHVVREAQIADGVSGGLDRVGDATTQQQLHGNLKPAPQATASLPGLDRPPRQQHLVPNHVRDDALAAVPELAPSTNLSAGNLAATTHRRGTERVVYRARTRVRDQDLMR